MALRNPNKKKQRKYFDNTESILKFNQSNPNSLSHNLEQENTSFELQEITLEDLDMMVINYFDNYFTINGKKQRLINGMIDSVSVKHLYPEIYNKEKETLIYPIFTIKRNNVSPRDRTNPSYKPNVYVIPEMKPQGLVYSEYVVNPVQYMDITYDFLFVTSFKETINEMVVQVRDYFKNKRNVINFNVDRFTIKPADYTSMFSENESDSPDTPKEFMLSFSFIVEGYLRPKDSIVKREMPNSYTLEIKTQHGKNFEMETLSKNEIRMVHKKRAE